MKTLYIRNNAEGKTLGCVTDENSDMQYLVNGCFDFPDMYDGSGRKVLSIEVKDGVLHSEDGPAIIFENERMHWYIDGYGITYDKWRTILKKTDEDVCFLKLKYPFMSIYVNGYSY